MTAWSILTASSSLPTGTAWQHLNAQQGGGPVTLVLYGETSAELMPEISAELDSEELEATVQSELSAVIEPEIGSEIE